MSSCNFCIYEDKIFDLNGYEILPDEDNIVTVFLNGLERRFKIDKMIFWLKNSGYKNLFREPKKVKVIVPKIIAVKEKKQKKVRIPRIKKQPKLCKCGSKMTSNTTCRKCYLASKPKQKQVYKKVEFDKRKNNSRTDHCRKIKCSNGKTYNSIIEAQKELNLTRSQIWHVCTGKWKHTKNLTFNYL